MWFGNSSKYLDFDQRHRTKNHAVKLATTAVVFLLIFTALTIGTLRWNTLLSGVNSRESQCVNPTRRREWRTLPDEQKYDYIRAVTCLKEVPSRLSMNHSLYDDFPWTHSRIGEYVHDAAPFLAWHRYFVHIYERALQSECGYKGNIPYWNWELDWKDVRKAPVWDGDLGFGSSGIATNSSSSILNGYCVQDGPFQGFEILYLDDMFYPHCLSRGFVTSDELEPHSQALHPDIIESIINKADYSSFNLGLENGPHLAIPRSIRGDFSLLTAPSDPVFFLHHTQLDRLWWKWQQKSSSHRRAYAGAAAHKSTISATVNDLLTMGNLASDVPVSLVLDTKSGLLCYEY